MDRVEEQASAASPWETPEAVVDELQRHARSLPEERRGEVVALLGELTTWERTRAEQVRGVEAGPSAIGAPRRTIAFFDGLPGAGKTTHIDRLVAEVGADYLSMARFAEARGISQDERRTQQLAGSLHPTDLEFLEAVKVQPGALLILEKFPRTPIEAAALVRLARREGWRLVGIQLYFPSAPIASSVRRQIERGPRRGRAITEREAARRAMNSLARSSSGRWALRDLGVPIHAIDSTRSLAQNAARIREALGLGFDRLGWNLATLQALEEVARAEGIEAWVSSGGLYRPFWNGRFGPMQRPTDIDVAVSRQEEVAPLLRALRRAHPRRRWSVLCPSEVLRRRYGIATGSIEEAKSYAALLHRAGMVRWNGSEVEVRLTPGAEASLRNGVVRLNERLLEVLSAEDRAVELAHVADKLARTLRDYPGLRIDPATAARLGGAVARHVPARILTAWRPLKSEAIRTQHDPRSAAFCRRALGPRERELAEEILRFHRQSDFRPEAPPKPARVELPGLLEAIREARERRKTGLPVAADDARWLALDEVAPPDGYASWLHHMALEADDDLFREWLLDQVHHHRPVGGADPWLRSLLDFSLIDSLPDRSREQSPMHQGWTLDQHLAASALELKTDGLRARFGAGTSSYRFEEVRLCMRMAMLFHDTGKLVKPKGASRGAPRRHALISARLWQKHRPDWFPARLDPLVRWMIATHDLFGAFGRGLTEKRGQPVGDYAVDLSLATSYFSALDAQAVRERLLDSGLPLAEATALNKAIWRADIGSISTLRWLLPVAELVERLVLEGEGRERRKTRSGERRAGAQRRRGGRRRLDPGAA